MAQIGIQTLNLTNANKPTLGAASASDTYPAGPGLFAVVSVGATATTITVVDPRTLSDTGQAAPDPSYAGVTNAEKWIPLPRNLADGNGNITITTSQQTNVNVACVQVV